MRVKRVEVVRMAIQGWPPEARRTADWRNPRQTISSQMGESRTATPAMSMAHWLERLLTMSSRVGWATTGGASL
jgi:hypothetical protein